MSLEDFHRSEQQQAMLAELPLAVARALDKGDGYLIRTVYDLVGVSRDYDSDRLVARFAVVHRERMVAW